MGSAFIVFVAGQEYTLRAVASSRGASGAQEPVRLDELLPPTLLVEMPLEIFASALVIGALYVNLGTTIAIAWVGLTVVFAIFWLLTLRRVRREWARRASDQ